MRTLAVWIGFLMLLGTSGGAAAQSEGNARIQSDAPAHRFTHLGVADGLTHRSVTALAQDSTGYLWIGTQAGLNRFDGVSMHPYRHVRGDSTSLPGHSISTLFVAPSGTLWVGTSDGLSRFDRRTETFRTYAPVPGDTTSLCGSRVYRLAHDGAGGLWVGTRDHGLCHFDPATETASRVRLLAPAASGETARTVTDLARTPTGEVWVSVGTPSGASVTCRLRGPRQPCDPASRIETSWPALWSDSDGTLWALQHQHGLLRYAEEPRPSFSLAISERVTWGGSSVAQPPDGTVWAGTPREGIRIFDPSSGTVQDLRPVSSDPRSLGGYDARVLLVDRQGTVWIGHERGLSYWTGAQRAFPLYRTTDGLVDDRVNNMHEARDGSVWIATNGGLSRYTPHTGRFQSYFPMQQGNARSDAVWQVYEDRKGRLWVGGKQDGLFRFDRKRERFIAVPGIGYGVRYIGEDRDGRLWVGTGNGLFARSPRTGQIRAFRHDATSRGLPNDRANVVHQTPDGTLWVGTDNGVGRLQMTPDGPAWERAFRYEDNDSTSLGAPIVWTFTHTPADSGAVWVGTFGGGLCRLNRTRSQFRCLTTADGLPHDVVYGVMADAEGMLWVTTDGGLARVHPATRRVTVFGTGQGFTDGAFDLMAYHRGASGRLYVGGSQGFRQFDPTRLRAERYAPPVVIAGVQIFDQARPGLLRPTGDTLRLRHDQNHISFDLAALDYTDPPSIRYRYRLRDASSGAPPPDAPSGWHTTDGTCPFAAYTNLAPGAYTFAVRATNHAGRWSPHEARLHLVVQPAWWQTAAFRWGLMLAAGALVAGGIRWRFAHLRQQQADALRVHRQLAEGRQRERHRLAHDLHDGPMQTLYRIGHDLDRLASLTETHAGAVQSTRDAVGSVTRELRAVLVALRPPHVAAFGLPSALRSLARVTMQRHPMLDVSAAVGLPEAVANALGDDVQYALYRIAQEALTNAVQHANATQITLMLGARGPALVLTVADNGDGFCVPPRLLDFAREEHFGLVGAAERAEAQGGHLDVTSTPGQGTTVQATIPHGPNR